MKRKHPTLPALASAARSAYGRPAKRTNGFAPAVTSGTRSTLAASALCAFINGVRLNVSLAADGRRIRTGIRPDTLSEHRFKIGTPYRVGGKAGESTESTNGSWCESAREVLRGVRVTSCPDEASD